MASRLKAWLMIGLVTLASSVHAAPACVSSSADPDGDGWGWENGKSCRVVKAPTPFCSSAAVDPDGDGWGWEQGKSCAVVDSPSPGYPVCSSAAVDPDGDGWGWESNKSCRVVAYSAVAASANTAFDITGKMGPGWNLANALDSLGGETNWGNPKTTQAMIDAVKNAGFKSIRIPVSWDDYTSGSNVTIAAWWLDRVEQVVQYGLNDGMYVILNVHHTKGTWESPTYANKAVATDHLQKLWKQIATRFAKYDNHLIFETMNEPRNGDDWWGTPEYFNVINDLNKAALGTIRATGGNNATRLVMLPTYVAGANQHQIDALVLPNDKMIAVSTHAYFPFAFALDAKGTASFSDTSEIDKLFQRLNAKFISKGIAVVMGEWASTNKNNLSERIRHAAYYSKAAKAVKIPTLWWDNGAFGTSGGDQMGLLNRTQDYWVYPDLLNAIINNSR